MEELLVIIFQFFFEVILNVLGNLSFDWPSQKLSRTKHEESIWLACMCWFLFANFAAWLSLFALPHTLISLPALRIANLMVAPIVSAYSSQVIAKRLQRHNDCITPRYHFWKSFWFTLGIVAVRFAYATRA